MSFLESFRNFWLLMIGVAVVFSLFLFGQGSVTGFVTADGGGSGCVAKITSFDFQSASISALESPELFDGDLVFTAVAEKEKKLHESEGIKLSVGLSGAWKKKGEDVESPQSFWKTFCAEGKDCEKLDEKTFTLRNDGSYSIKLSRLGLKIQMIIDPASKKKSDRIAYEFLWTGKDKTRKSFSINNKGKVRVRLALEKDNCKAEDKKDFPPQGLVEAKPVPKTGGFGMMDYGKTRPAAIEPAAGKLPAGMAGMQGAEGEAFVPPELLTGAHKAQAVFFRPLKANLKLQLPKTRSFKERLELDLGADAELYVGRLQPPSGAFETKYTFLAPIKPNPVASKVVFYADKGYSILRCGPRPSEVLNGPTSLMCYVGEFSQFTLETYVKNKQAGGMGMMPEQTPAGSKTTAPKKLSGGLQGWGDVVSAYAAHAVFFQPPSSSSASSFFEKFNFNGPESLSLPKEFGFDNAVIVVGGDIVDQNGFTFTNAKSNPASRVVLRQIGQGDLWCVQESQAQFVKGGPSGVMCYYSRQGRVDPNTPSAPFPFQPIGVELYN
ncbi:hypothetical protein HZC09_03830 [Candidatus Micrarchaeota archaeon]|nr:hypothetical protein [Candidatus Micrarchaeota archaeon]